MSEIIVLIILGVNINIMVLVIIIYLSVHYTINYIHLILSSFLRISFHAVPVQSLSLIWNGLEFCVN